MYFSYIAGRSQFDAIIRVGANNDYLTVGECIKGSVCGTVTLTLGFTREPLEGENKGFEFSSSKGGQMTYTWKVICFDSTLVQMLGAIRLRFDPDVYATLHSQHAALQQVLGAA